MTLDFVNRFVGPDSTSLAKNGDEQLTAIYLDPTEINVKNLTLKVTRDSSEITDFSTITNADGLIALQPTDKVELQATAGSQREHSDDDYSLNVTYDYTDITVDSNGELYTENSIGNTAVYNVTVGAETDIPTVTLSNPTSSNPDGVIDLSDDDTTNNSFTQTVTLSSPDTDGSESFTRLEVTDVPEGIEIVGGSLINGKWYVDFADKTITDTSPTVDITFKKYSSFAAGEYEITVCGFNLDSNSDASGGIEVREQSNISSFKFTLISNPDGGGVVSPDLVATLEATDATIDEGGSIKVSELLSGTLNSPEADNAMYSFALSGLPEETVLSLTDPTNANNSNVSISEQGGVWVITADNNVISPNDALALVTLTPPVDYSTNTDSEGADGPLSFNAEFTAFNQLGQESTAAEVTISVNPVTDPMDANGSVTDIDSPEDSSVSFDINLTSSKDGNFQQIVEGKVYLKLETDPSWGDDMGVLSANGEVLIAQTFTVDQLPEGMEAGTYYVYEVADTDSDASNGITPPSSITFDYQQPANADGEVSITAYTPHAETDETDSTNNGDTLISTETVNITVTAEPDSLDVQRPNGSVITGDEDGDPIAINYTVSNIDEGDELGAVKLSSVPEGYTVYTAEAADPNVAIDPADPSTFNYVLVSNVSEGSLPDTNNWIVSVADPANPPLIFIKPFEDASGVSNLTLSVISTDNILGNSVDVTLEVNPVVDGVDFSPTETFGDEYAWQVLNLNADMVDRDGSETVKSFVITAAAGETPLEEGMLVKLANGDIVKPVFDNGTYTLQGLTADDLNNLQVLYKAYQGTWDISATVVDSVPDLADSEQVSTTSIALNLNPSNQIATGDEDNFIDLTMHTAPVTVNSGGGDDRVEAGSGDDIINGGTGDDSLYGNAGDDTLSGDEGNDLLRGARGDDILNGGDGDDELYGGSGDDTLDGGAGSDKLYGDTGDDILVYSADNSVMNGGEGKDTLLLLAEDAGTIDFSTLVSNVAEIEVVDLSEANMSLESMTLESVLKATDDLNNLTIQGDSGDNVQLAGNWTQGDTSVGYTSYTLDNATVLIATEANTTII